MKRIFWIISLVLTVALAACGTPSTPPPPVSTDVPATQQTDLIRSGDVVASAKVLPAREAQMSFVVSAPVKEVLVKEGDRVTEGQTLMTLYSPTLELSVTEAQLELKASELDYVYWVPRFDRPPERREQAKAEVEQARTKLKTAEAGFAQTSLAAPFDAMVVDINIQAGEFAQTGQVVITLGDLTNMQVETTDLGERDVPAIKIGQAVNVYIEALDTNVTGKVIRVSPISKVIGGDVVYPVTVELDEQPDGLLWGMSAEVNIQSAP